MGGIYIVGGRKPRQGVEKTKIKASGVLGITNMHLIVIVNGV